MGVQNDCCHDSVLSRVSPSLAIFAIIVLFLGLFIPVSLDSWLNVLLVWCDRFLALLQATRSKVFRETPVVFITLQVMPSV